MNPKLTPERLLKKAIVYVRQSKPSQLIHNQESQRLQYKNKLFKRHAASIRRPFAGFPGLWRRHIMQFMLTWGESCPGLLQLFRRRVKISAVGRARRSKRDTPTLSFNWPWSFEGEGKLLEDCRRHRRRA